MTKTTQRMKALMGFIFLVLFATFPACFSQDSQFAHVLTKSTSNRFGSSAIFLVQGNVYPLGYYSVHLKIGNPFKVYDLDIDTGSDFTWVQCDAPCTGCTKTFDLATMNHDDVDFTASAELEPYSGGSTGMSNDLECQTRSCYGVVLWFETGFTSRFCKEMPVVLSTSPYTPKTHWSQTILTFREPIAMASGKPSGDRLAAIGTEACPATKIQLRVSIARAVEHRSIDISLETVGIGSDGRKCKWPVQIFNLH